MSATGSERAPRSRAGPSKPVAKSKRKPAKVVEEEEEEGESDDFTEAVREDAEDEVMEVDPPPTRRAASRKGKAKADAAPTKKQPSPSAAARAINDATTNNGMAAPTRRVAGSTAATKQLEKLRRQLETDLLIKQHQEMLSRKEPLSRDGKTSVLHMVTREDADAEKRSAEEQVAYWKGQLSAIPRPSALRGRGGGPNGVLGSDDPKHSELVRFYEDVTNLLEPRYFNLDEWSFTCIYTYADKTGIRNKQTKSIFHFLGLGFLLRFTYDPFPETAAVEPAQYTPLNLDKEPPPFIAALQFLNTGFTFPRKQLPLFYNSLVTNMKAACEPESDQSEAESDPEQENDSMQDVQLVE
ncbi:hypothetical protein B0H14DRAFT_2661370 [Mycena olivaceomarginata]|nr:hypothetical protein B0H14DRAFT_2661370 [Mycena olivaceomarginata]